MADLCSNQPEPELQASFTWKNSRALTLCLSPFQDLTLRKGKHFPCYLTKFLSDMEKNLREELLVLFSSTLNLTPAIKP